MCRTDSQWEDLQKQQERRGAAYTRKCIDGRVTGCGNCVGYCQYAGHPGYLTDKLRDRHACLEKGCHYFLPKPKPGRDRFRADKQTPARILSALQEKVSNDGVRFLSVKPAEENTWCVSFVTITKEYSFAKLQKTVEEIFDCSLRFRRLDVNFDICAEMIMAG